MGEDGHCSSYTSTPHLRTSALRDDQKWHSAHHRPDVAMEVCITIYRRVCTSDELMGNSQKWERTKVEGKARSESFTRSLVNLQTAREKADTKPRSCKGKVYLYGFWRHQITWTSKSCFSCECSSLEAACRKITLENLHRLAFAPGP